MSKRKKSKTSRVESLQQALEIERKKSDEYLSRLKYLQADFENYRKRMEKEIRETAQTTSEKLIINLLNVVDELELALGSGKEAEDKQALLKGVEMTLKKLSNTLEQEGLARIKAVGEAFDPSFHEVLTETLLKKHGEGVVVKEVRAGYMLSGRVIRPAIVEVATKLGVDS
jgi:molecular chaperone GrpE